MIVQRVRSEEDFLKFVDGFIGTAAWDTDSEFDDGRNLGNTTLPQIRMPFAHTPLTPQTSAVKIKCISPYYYDDLKWTGLHKSHFMSGSCVYEYGSVTILPSVALNVSEALNYHALNHSLETWTPSTYQVELPESGFTVTATNLNAAGIVKLQPPQKSIVLHTCWKFRPGLQ